MSDIRESLAMASVLIIIVLVSTAILSLTERKTASVIQENDARKAGEIAARIFFEADGTAQKEGFKEVYQDDRLIGYLVEASSRGYSSDIRIIAGFSPDKSIRSVVILSQQETPGLGTKVAEPGFLGQFEGLPLMLAMTRKDGGSVDAVTGATMSSRAVTEAVRIASEALP